MITLQKSRVTVPSAFITKGKQRLKQYDGSTVYLNGGDNFEIELFNPTQNRVLANIELNGNLINGGVILRPGERVFLERHIDTPQKFEFITYTVDSNMSDVVKNNGTVTVYFYSETHFPVWPSVTYTPIYQYYQYSGNLGLNTGTSHPISTTGNISFANANSINFCNTSTNTANIETGRVEKGGNSQQRFWSDDGEFSTYASWTCEWKILPLSQKHVVVGDIKTYCTTCGRKQRKGENYCPVCGKKY